MEHYELVQEMPSIERMSTQERLKHARKRRSQQLKKWGQYEKQLEKESSKKKKHPEKHQSQKRPKKSNRGNIKFAPNIVLLEAAARNDLNEVRRLLESGVDPDVTNEDGLTALHQCCIDNSEELMKLLLDHGANVNACDSEMWTPLHAAATCGHMNLCKHLIDRGAELLAVNADGNMPYDICEDEFTLDHIETEMAKRGITQEQIDVTRLATEHQMLADLREYASRGGDLEFTDHMGATMLHIASANGYLEVAEFLLDNNVSVDTRDHESWQAVHAAAYWAQQEILELLVESGADLDSKTKNGETPFDLCEEPDLKQKILDMKDEIETKRVIRQQRPGSQRKPRVSSRNASIRRSSMRGDKTQLFKKEHKEEALHFGLNLMNDEESLVEAEEEHEHTPATDLDEVTVMVTSDEEKDPPSPPTAHLTAVDGSAPDSPPAAVTTIHVNKPTPKRRNTPHHPEASSPANGSQSPTPSESQNPTSQSSGGQKRESTAPKSSLPADQNEADSNQASSPKPIHPPVSGERKMSGPTLSDLKKERSNSRENLVDMAVQDMFLKSVQGGRNNPDTVVQGNSVAGGGGNKATNGHNNNNNAVHHSTTDGQLRRFVAPTHAQVVGGDEDEKQNCCVVS